MGINAKRNFGIALTLGTIALGQSAPAAQAGDLINELDKVVVAMHDYSTLNGTITQKADTNVVKNAVSNMNSQLFTIKNALKKLDGDITSSWLYLSPKANTTYPARNTLRNFDLAAYAWFNFEVSAQSKISSCFSSGGSGKGCVLTLKKKNSHVELIKYSKVTDQLTIIEKWRTSVGR